MALNGTGAQSNAVFNAIKGAMNIFSGINKAKGVSEDPSPEPIDEYESTLDEKEIIALKSEWQKTYNQYYANIEPSQKLAFEYWIGKQKTDDDVLISNTNNPLIDNLIFEAVETFLPIATRANPDPLVQSDPSPLAQKAAGNVKSALVFEADRQKLKTKLANTLRNWLIYRVGIVKFVWDVKLGRIRTEVINPKRMIFDKDGHWDENCEFTGEYLGEKKSAIASDLIELFPKKKADIIIEAGGKMGTKIDYIEWWYKNTDVFFTMKDVVLGKFKNPHWNYDGTTPGEADEDGEETEDTEVEGKNHLEKISSPYRGLAIFSTGLQPHDETSLILQNIPIQDMINRRWNQQEANIKSMNNGLAVNGAYFTEEQASQAATARKRGIAIRIPMQPGQDLRGAIDTLPAQPIPDQVFEMQRDGRSELRNIFGTAGSSSQGLASQDTVRGKILVNQLDSSRIGGGITERLEQLADASYNYWVQMMFVHWTEEQFINAIGVTGGAEMVMIRNTMFLSLKTLNVTVKEGSLIPKDPLTQRNEAMDLWSANAIDPRTLFAKLGYGDPNESAKQLILWQMVQKGALPPQAYIPNFEIPGQTALPQAGVGDEDVNALGPDTPPPAPDTGTGEAAEAESKQLLSSVPIK